MAATLTPPRPRPGPDKGFQSPQPSNAQQGQIENGRPRVSASAPPPRNARSGAPASPGVVAAPPPIQPVGFTIPWDGMDNPNMPQPTAEFGVPSYNPFTGEWFRG